MKNLTDLFNKMAEATESNSKYNTWFFRMSGHVNKLHIQYYLGGWDSENQGSLRECEVTLDEGGIQEAYWFITNNLK